MKNFRTLFALLLLAAIMVLVQSFAVITGWTSTGDPQVKQKVQQNPETQKEPRLSNQFESQDADTEPKPAHEARTSEQHQAVITWRGGRRDHRWSNPRNWNGGRLPGTADITRITPQSKPDVIVDPDCASGL